MSQDLHGFKIWFAIGATVLLIGLALQWYPSSIIHGFNEQLALSNMSPYDINATRENLNSWKIMQAFVFQPTSIGFFTGGILILIYSVLSTVFSIASAYSKRRTD
jgi:hypothetical protein